MAEMSFDVAIKITQIGAQAVANDLGRVQDAAAKLDGSTRRVGDGAGYAGGNLARMGVAGGGLLAVATSAGLVARELWTAGVNAERLRTGLNFASGGRGGEEIDYLRTVTKSLGLEFDSTATAYMGFAAAARQTKLEGQGARDVFEAVAQASTVMGLSAEQNQGVLLALSQMISKGTVSAEELRGQLGERMPGAFQIAARAMGVTTAELGKMLEQGQVLSEDFLPKFARQIREELGGSVEAASNRLEASTNRMGNAWQRLKERLSEGATPGLNWLAKETTNDLDAMGEAMDRAKTAGSGFFGQLSEAARVAVGRSIGLDRIDEDFQSSAQSAEMLTSRLADAQAELARYQKGLTQAPAQGTYLYQAIEQAKANVVSLQAAVDKAREFKALLSDLSGLSKNGSGQADPEAVRFERQAARAAEQAKVRSKYASKEDGLRAELESVRKAFDGMIPADLEARIRDKFITPSKAAKDAAKELREQLQATAEATNRALVAQIGTERETAARTEQLREQTALQRATNKAVLDGSNAVEELEIAKLRESAVTADRMALHAMERLQNDALADQYREQASALRELADERARGVDVRAQAKLRDAQIESAKRVGEEWRRQVEGLEQSLTDALLRGFESGKDFGRNFRDTLVNMFKTLVLKPIIQPIMGGIAGGVGGFFGLSGPAQAAGGGIGGVGSGNLVSSMLGQSGLLSASGLGIAGNGFLGSAAGTFQGMFGVGELSSLTGAEAFSGGYNALLGGNVSGGAGTLAGAAGAYLAGIGIGRYAGQAISGGYSASGNSGNRAVNAGAVVGAVVGGPIGAAIGGAIGGGINRLFGRKAKEFSNERVEGSIGAGGFSGSTLTDFFQKGGLFRSDKRGTESAAVDTAFDSQLDAGVKLLYKTTAEYAKVLGLPVSSVERYTGQFKVAIGKTEEETQAAITAAFTGLGTDLAGVYRDKLQPFVKAGEDLGATLARLAGLQTFTNSLASLGGIFSRISGLSVDARENLISLAGGMEQLSAQALGFVQEYYSRDEIAGFKAREIQQVLQDAGLSTNINSREDFRALVEGAQVDTEAGRQHLATLLSISSSFATVADYLQESGNTLNQAAANAPLSGSLGPLLATGNQQVGAINEVRDATIEVRNGIERLNTYFADLIANGGDGGAGFVRGPRAPEVGLAR